MDNSLTINVTEMEHSHGKMVANIQETGKKASSTASDISKATPNPKSKRKVSGSTESASAGSKTTTKTKAETQPQINEDRY